MQLSAEQLVSWLQFHQGQSALGVHYEVDAQRDPWLLSLFSGQEHRVYLLDSQAVLVFSQLARHRNLYFYYGGSLQGYVLEKYDQRLYSAGDAFVLNRLLGSNYYRLRDILEFNGATPPKAPPVGITLSSDNFADYLPHLKYLTAGLIQLEQLLTRIKSKQYSKTEYTVERKLLPYFFLYQRRGLVVDTSDLAEFKRQVREAAEQRYQRILRLLNRDEHFKLSSPQQLSTALFNSPEITPPQPVLTKTGKVKVVDQRDLPGLGLEPQIPGRIEGHRCLISVKRDHLLSLRESHPVIQEILDYRDIDLARLEDLACFESSDGRIYPEICSWLTDGVSCFRTKSPDLQLYLKDFRLPLVSNSVRVCYEPSYWQAAIALTGNRKLFQLDWSQVLSDIQESLSEWSVSLEVCEQLRDFLYRDYLFSDNFDFLNKFLSDNALSAFESFLDSYFFKINKFIENFCKNSLRRSGFSLPDGGFRVVSDARLYSTVWSLREVTWNAALQAVMVYWLKRGFLRLQESAFSQQLSLRLLYPEEFGLTFTYQGTWTSVESAKLLQLFTQEYSQLLVKPVVSSFLEDSF